MEKDDCNPDEETTEDENNSKIKTPTIFSDIVTDPSTYSTYFKSQTHQDVDEQEGEQIRQLQFRSPTIKPETTQQHDLRIIDKSISQNRDILSNNITENPPKTSIQPETEVYFNLSNINHAELSRKIRRKAESIETKPTESALEAEEAVGVLEETTEETFKNISGKANNNEQQEDENEDDDDDDDEDFNPKNKKRESYEDLLRIYAGKTKPSRDEQTAPYDILTLKERLCDFLAESIKKRDASTFIDLIKDLKGKEIKKLIKKFRNKSDKEKKKIADTVLPSILTEDAHLVAIKRGDLLLAQYLLDLLKDREQNPVKNSRLYNFPVTPLMVAILCENEEMVRVLIRRNHVLRQEDININKKMDSELVYHRCKASMSPIYIHETQSNPFVICLQYTKIIRSMSKISKQSMQLKFEKIIEKMEEYCIALFRNMKNKTDIELILSQNVRKSAKKSRAFETMQFPVLQEMIQQRWAKFLFEPLVQELRNRIWMGKCYITEKEKQQRFCMVALLRLVINMVLHSIAFWSASPQQCYLISAYTETWLCISLILRILHTSNHHITTLMFLFIVMWAFCYTGIVIKQSRFPAVIHKTTVLDKIILLTTGLYSILEILATFTHFMMTDSITHAINIFNDFLIYGITAAVYAKVIKDSLQSATRTIKSPLQYEDIILIAFYSVCVLVPIIFILLNLICRPIVNYIFPIPQNHTKAITILGINLFVVILVEVIISPEILEDKQRNFKWTAKVITEYHTSEKSLPIPHSFLELIGVLNASGRDAKDRHEKKCIEKIMRLKELTSIKKIKST